jgi:hypothetical protein
MANFKLSPLFLNNYEGKQPNWGFGDLSYFVYKRTYARIMDDGNQEEYIDTCRRVTEGVFNIQMTHCKTNRLPWKPHKAQKSAQEFFRRMWQFKFTPPGRGFWIMGTSMVDKVGSAALNNCGFTSTKDVSVDLGNSFAWSMDMLMLGVGVGFDTAGAGAVVIKGQKENKSDFVIPDTREGWVESVYSRINSYMGGPNYHYIYDEIRKAGTPIRGFGGTASGPGPLRQLHESIDSILRPLIGLSLTSVAIVDLMNFIGKCVVAGNVRRSAEIAIGEIDDVDYVTMKDYNKYSRELSDRRWASNNSVFAHADSNFAPIAPNIALNGEPGLIFLDNARHYGRLKDGWHAFESDKYDDVDGFNPCAEQSLEDKELCCLVETYPANHDSAEDYLITLKFAYMYAKTVTLVPTHDERTNSVMMRNRRIGCSMSGIQQAVAKFGLQRFLSTFCDSGYKEIKSLDRIYSRWLGVPRSIKTTTVKPSGTVSILAGATPGVHWTHSENYIRTVRCDASNELVKRVIAAGYKVEFERRGTGKAILLDLLVAGDYITTEQEQYILSEDYKDGEPNDAYEEISRDITKDPYIFEGYINANGTVIINFPVKEKEFTKSKFDVSIWEQMAIVREMQYWWSDNSVSVTVTIREHEKEELARAIEFYAPYVKTLSFLPLTDHRYDQAPYQEVSEGALDDYIKTIKTLDLSNTAESVKGSKFCTNDSCEI